MENNILKNIDDKTLLSICNNLINLAILEEECFEAFGGNE